MLPEADDSSSYRPNIRRKAQMARGEESIHPDSTGIDTANRCVVLKDNYTREADAKGTCRDNERDWKAIRKQLDIFESLRIDKQE